MVVTIDVIKVRRRRDLFRLLRRPARFYSAEPAFIRSFLVSPDFRSADTRGVTVMARWEGEPGSLKLEVSDLRRSTFDVQKTHGTLRGGDPLANSLPARGEGWGGAGSGPGAIWTCGSVRLRKLPAFLRANAAVVRELNQMPGLRQAVGVMGLGRGGPYMCTLSFWDDVDQGLAFAYRSSPVHREAIKAMRSGAYGTRESYFARLGLREAKAAVAA